MRHWKETAIESVCKCKALNRSKRSSSQEKIEAQQETNIKTPSPSFNYKYE